MFCNLISLKFNIVWTADVYRSCLLNPMETGNCHENVHQELGNIFSNSKKVLMTVSSVPMRQSTMVH